MEVGRLGLDVLVPVVQQMNPRKMSEVLAAMAPDRAEKLTVTAGDLYADLSKNLITERTRDLLLQLATSSTTELDETLDRIGAIDGAQLGTQVKAALLDFERGLAAG